MQTISSWTTQSTMRLRQASIEFCGVINLFHKILSNDGLIAFHYKSYGTFLILKKVCDTRDRQ